MFFLFLEPGAEIDVVLHGEGPFPAADVGKLLSAIALDYKQTTRGRTLVVAGFDKGSLISQLADLAAVAAPHLKDAAEVAKGIKAVREFSQAVSSAFKRAKAPYDLHQEAPPRRGERTVQALAELASEKRYEVEYRYAGDGEAESEEVRITPLEAIEIRERAKLRALELKASRTGLISGSEPQQLLTHRAATIAENIVHQSGSALSSDVQALIKALVKTLQDSGLHRLVEMVAQNLEARGQDELAEAVRQERFG